MPDKVAFFVYVVGSRGKIENAKYFLSLDATDYHVRKIKTGKEEQSYSLALTAIFNPRYHAKLG